VHAYWREATIVTIASPFLLTEDDWCLALKMVSFSYGMCRPAPLLQVIRFSRSSLARKCFSCFMGPHYFGRVLTGMERSCFRIGIMEPCQNLERGRLVCKSANILDTRTVSVHSHSRRMSPYSVGVR